MRTMHATPRSNAKRHDRGPAVPASLVPTAGRGARGQRF
jgi:hypothetical protein